MRRAVIVASTRGPADVHGVHGTEGLTHWTCLARRPGLLGGWEAVEWACLPPGAVSGEHLHTRTEEVYVLLSGRGEISLDGRTVRVEAGDVVLTGLGTRHGLRNTGPEPLEWLVIEMTAVKLPAQHPTHPTHPSYPSYPAGPAPVMRSTVVTNLRRVGSIDPSVVLSGPLRRLRIVRLRPGERAELAADAVEHTAFVTAGGGRAAPGGAQTGELRVPLAPGTALTLPLGTGAVLTAGPDGLEYLHAVLAVPGAAEGGGAS
ncbi:mannose-6-phosphate isomerase-like protein (cupin superfamily) [Kitasatospora sp. MAA4]|uniref:cupin domain-containing protein n=1 Tax=Kitasatospora sp. MAA4 TaxID=3035093 RepID=UPI002473D05D|nr:cupin domain-containing protein [Kitasatospora sp. MAA4]MDH6135579.1 mannose-6-phosphate isomerase-like protein (cupin superfamily) [Kitasatospora sp. MAA4]